MRCPSLNGKSNVQCSTPGAALTMLSEVFMGAPVRAEVVEHGCSHGAASTLCTEATNAPA